jgi:hypothetical protein
MVYEMPSFEPLSSVASQMATPVWEHEIHGEIAEPSFHVIHPTQDTHPDGRVIIWTGKLFMTLTPSPGHPGGYHLHLFKNSKIQTLKNPYGMGNLSPVRFFWLSRAHKTIMTCTLALGEANDGSMRLERAHVEPQRIDGAMHRVVLEETMTYAPPVSPDVPPLDIYKASVEWMSWDEESGRLCLLLGSEAARTIDEACPKEIVVIDFV